MKKTQINMVIRHGLTRVDTDKKNYSSVISVFSVVKNQKNNGSILIVVVFAIALLTAMVAGMLQLDVEQLQLVRNETYAAEALAIAEAGIAEAFAELRSDSSWTDGINNKSFAGGQYTVAVTGTLPSLEIESQGTSQQGFVAKVKAAITISDTKVIRIDKLRINE